MAFIWSRSLVVRCLQHPLPSVYHCIGHFGLPSCANLVASLCCRSCSSPAAPCTWRSSTVASSHWHTASGRGTAGPGCRPPTTTAYTSSSPTSPSPTPCPPCSRGSTPTMTSSGQPASRSARGRPSRWQTGLDSWGSRFGFLWSEKLQVLNILFISYKNSAVLRVDVRLLGHG
jgi:hypothetical protein